MTAPILAFFNTKGRMGMTTLVYHLSWMYVELGLRVLVADLDPQANLTATFLDEDRLEGLWPGGDHPNTIFGCIQSLMQGVGDVAEPHLEEVELDQVGLLGVQESVFRSPLALLVGDLFLSSFEDSLSEAWLKCLDQDERSFRVVSAFWRIMQLAATKQQADVVLIDIGPNLDAINRSALIAADFVIATVSPDLSSAQGLRNLRSPLQRWRDGWKERLTRNGASNMPLPRGEIRPSGYIVLQPSMRMDRLASLSYWIARIPEEYREYILNETVNDTMAVRNDPYCLALLRHYPGLIHLAQEAHKPMFSLKPADGALGAHMKAAQDAFLDYRSLAQKIARQTNIPLV